MDFFFQNTFTYCIFLPRFPQRAAAKKCCGGCGKYYKDAAAQDEIKQEDTVIAKRRVYYAPSLYPVRNGTNPPSGTEYSGGVYGLIFRAAVSGITGVQVDGRTSINYKNLSEEEFRWFIRILKKSKKMGTPISQRKKR